ncbi:MAG: nucleotidyltransferase family protein, partial [Rhodanobacteraceae bacterium]
HRAARLALATAPADCIVVLGSGAERMVEVLGDLPVRAIRCVDCATGMAASLQAGLRELKVECDGALVLLTDQPGLDAAHLVTLCKRWRERPSRAVASAYAGVVGVPALLPRHWFDALMHIEGDRGARDLLRDRADEVSAIAAPALARDVDRPRDLPTLGHD